LSTFILKNFFWLEGRTIVLRRITSNFPQRKKVVVF
jgi:hypothetical protein